MSSHLAELEAPETDLLPRATATPRDQRIALALIVGYVTVVLGLEPWSALQGPSVPQSVAVFTTGIVLAEMTTAFLLFGQLRFVSQWSLLLISCAYLFSSLMGIAHLVTFPGAITPDRPLFGGSQLTSYVFNSWRLGFAAIILAGMLVFPRISETPDSNWRTIVTLSGVTVVVTVILGFAVALVAEEKLPVVVADGQFTTLGLFASWAALAVGLLALVALWIRTRGQRLLLHLWLTMAMVAFCGDLFISTIGGGRYTVGWYTARTSGFLSGSMLFLFFLMRFVAQQRRSIETARALRERTFSLQVEIARRSKVEQRLVQSQKVEAMGQLTGGIAHDFNNLLAAIVGNLDLLRRRTDLDSRAVRYIENALTAAERGTKLTNQLLVFSRSHRLELKPVLPENVIAEMLELLMRTLGPQIKIRMDVSTANAPVLSEPTQLELALLNLAINARDAMPDGGELTISVKPLRISNDPELENGDYVQLSVTDTGVGMEPEIADRAFEPFFTTKGVGKGTGLGLSQVFGIARQAGGTARIESRPGKGTTVHLLLRRTEALGLPTEGKSGGAYFQNTPAMTVLVIDDDPDVRQFLVNFIVELGLTAVEADDGPSGLKAIDSSKPDLVLVDFAMPGMTGAEMGKRARERCPGLPIVFVTGYGDTTAIESAVGPDASIVRKPFRAFELQAAIAEAIRPKS